MNIISEIVDTLDTLFVKTLHCRQTKCNKVLDQQQIDYGFFSCTRIIYFVKVHLHDAK